MNEKDLFLREIDECIEILKEVRDITRQEKSSWGRHRCNRQIGYLLLIPSKISGAIKVVREVQREK